MMDFLLAAPQEDKHILPLQPAPLPPGAACPSKRQQAPVLPASSRQDADAAAAAAEDPFPCIVALLAVPPQTLAAPRAALDVT